MTTELQEIKELSAAHWIRWRMVWLPRLAVVGLVAGVGVVSSFISCAWHEELARFPLVVHDTVAAAVVARVIPEDVAVMARMCHNRLNFGGLTRADSVGILNAVELNNVSGGAVECATWIAEGDK